MPYTINKIEDKYYVTNDGLVDDLVFTVNVYTVSDGYVEQESITVAAEGQVEISLLKDGEYKLIFDDLSEVIIKYFLELETEAIVSIEKLFCGCNDCCNTSECYNLVTTKNKLDAYTRLTGVIGNVTFTTIYNKLKDILITPIYKTMQEELVLGTSKNSNKLFKQLIAIDYLALYYTEFTTEEEEYINNKFKKTIIFDYIQELGINILDIKQSL